jgi:hypothetical protein
MRALKKIEVGVFEKKEVKYLNITFWREICGIL